MTDAHILAGGSTLTATTGGVAHDAHVEAGGSTLTATTGGVAYDAHVEAGGRYMTAGSGDGRLQIGEAVDHGRMTMIASKHVSRISQMCW